ncbi:UNVERIFIED_CONTAM: hypothetical protein FKN15_008740 [Acipenser sinensis]
MGRRGWKGAQEDEEVKDREEECRLRARHPRPFSKPSQGCLLCDQDHLFANCPFCSYDEEPERPQPKREEPERPQPKREEPERPTPEWEEPERPMPEWGEPERPQPKRGESVHPQPKRGESVRPQPKREESVRPQPKREESVRSQPKKREVGASTALGPKPPAEGECLLVLPPPAEEQCLLSPSTPAEEQGLLSQCPPAEEACLLVHLLLPSQEPEGEELQAQPPEFFWGGEGQDAGVPQQPLFMLLKAAQRTPGSQHRHSLPLSGQHQPHRHCLHHSPLQERQSSTSPLQKGETTRCSHLHRQETTRCSHLHRQETTRCSHLHCFCPKSQKGRSYRLNPLKFFGGEKGRMLVFPSSRCFCC